MSWLKEAVDQVIASKKPALVITKHARSCMAELSVTDKDVANVYYHGTEVKVQKVTRESNGYEYGLFYFRDRKTGNVIVTSVWKHILKRR